MLVIEGYATKITLPTTHPTKWDCLASSNDIGVSEYLVCSVVLGKQLIYFLKLVRECEFRDLVSVPFTLLIVQSSVMLCVFVGNLDDAHGILQASSKICGKRKSRVYKMRLLGPS